MKREKISLFILLLEIVLITMLHSAKSNRAEDQQVQVTKKTGTSTAAYQLPAGLPLKVLR